MKKPIILFFIAYLIAWAIAPANASEATLTTQAKHILMQELENNNVDKSLNKQIVCLAENIYFEARAET